MRGIKQAGFYVLVGAAMPKVLIEYLLLISEAKLLNKSSYRSEMAYGIFKGVQTILIHIILKLYPSNVKKILKLVFLIVVWED